MVTKDELLDRFSKNARAAIISGACEFQWGDLYSTITLSKKRMRAISREIERSPHTTLREVLVKTEPAIPPGTPAQMDDINKQLSLIFAFELDAAFRQNIERPATVLAAAHGYRDSDELQELIDSWKITRSAWERLRSLCLGQIEDASNGVQDDNRGDSAQC